MKNKFTILGCGSSLGSPWITNYRGDLKKNPKNIRTRCCAHIQYKDLSILIDTSPDIKNQFLDNKIRSLDAIIYTHEHADQTSGIFEMRPFFWKNKNKIPVYGSKRTVTALIKKYTFCFFPKHGYVPIMKANVIKKSFKIKKKNQILSIKAFDVIHGMIKATGFRFEKVAYISDCNDLSIIKMNKLKNLKYLILDCLKIVKNYAHFNLDECLFIYKHLKPKKMILTNLHTDLDYDYLSSILPKGVIPAYDGLKINL